MPDGVEAHAHGRQIEFGHNAPERIIHTDDADILGHATAAILQTKDRAIRHLVVRRIHGCAFGVVGELESGTIPAVRPPVTNQGLRCGDAMAIKLVAPPLQSAARRTRLHRPSDMMHGAVPLFQQIIDNARGAPILVGVHRGAVRRCPLAHEHDRHLFRRNEGIKIRDILLQHDDDAVNRQLRHALDRSLQRTFLADAHRAYGDRVPLIHRSRDDAVKNAGIAVIIQAEHHDADIVEPAVFERTCGIVGTIAELVHRFLDAHSGFVTHTFAPVGDAGDRLGRNAGFPCNILHRDSQVPVHCSPLDSC